MKKKNGVRLTADKDGNIEVTFKLPAESVAEADEWAERLPATRDEIIASYVLQLAETLHEGMREHCLVSWSFPTRAAVKSFIKREKLDRNGTGVIAWRDGGFGVDTLFKYDELLKG